MTTIIDFQAHVIKKGIESAKKRESGAELMGALEGFDLCKKLTRPEEFEEMLTKCNKEDHDVLFREDRGRGGLYRRLRYRTLQVEWVYEIMKVAWSTIGIKVGKSLSARAVMKYHEFYNELEETNVHPSIK